MMINNRIILEKGLSEDQLVKLYLHYKQEDQDRKEQLKANNREFFNEIKSVMNSMKPDILKSHNEWLRKGA